MKTILGYIVLLLIAAAVYWLDIFSLIAGKGFMIFIFIVIAIIFVFAFRILGNPLAGRKDDENK